MISNSNMFKINQRIPPQTGYFNNNYNYNNRTYNNNIINNNSEVQRQSQILTQRTIINNNNSGNNNKIKCTCSKTGCTKKYCACFSKGILCDGCECKNCENCVPRINELSLRPGLDSVIKGERMLENDDYNKKEEIQINKNQRVICNCTKSNCMKKYCECFKQGFNCNSLCRCLDCKNKIYITNMNDFTENHNNLNNININNENPNYNLNSNIKNNTNNNSILSNDFINNNNNFYNYALHNNINNNIINNNIINSPSYIPETFGKSLDYSNPINFQPEAFGIYIKKEKLKIDIRKLNLNSEKEINDKNNINNDNNNFGEFNETPKFSNKKRLRPKNENSNSTSVKTCPTTNSSNKIKKAITVVNKNIKKKKLQLN